VLATATETFESVFVDVAAPIEEDEALVADRIPFRRNQMTTAALDRADLVLLVTSADPIGLRRGVIAHRMFSERTAAGSDVAVVLNRMPSSGRHAQDCSRAVETWVGAPPAALLPIEPTFCRVVWEGRSMHAVAPRSKWLRELQDLFVQVAS
jgi:Flp pilus assembly CpaE family ATPase